MSRKLSRRSFFKLSAAATAVLAASTALPKMLTWGGEKNLEGATEYVNSFCEMCTSRCPIQAKIVDGRQVVVHGNPGWAATGGTVCARGASGVSQLFDPQRLQKPLIRAGERGEGKWREVSWDEAYAYVAERMQAIKTQYGPESVAFACRKGPHMGLFFNLAKAYGSPNTFSHESTCPMAKTVALETTFGTASLGIDYGNVKYLITFGRNYFEGIHVAQARGVMTAVSRGAKLVSFDPRFSVTSAKAHEWYPVKPGTDLAVVLALIHVLIKDNLYDKAFVDQYTAGFDALQASVAAYTPAWAEGESGVPAQDITRLAHELAAARPRAVLDWGWRTTFTPAEYDLRRAIVIANMLLGNLEVPGGTFFVKDAGFINNMVGEPVAFGLHGPKLPPFTKSAKPRLDGAGIKGQPYGLVPPLDGVVQQVPEAILTEQPYPIKGWFVHRYNPVITISNTTRVIEALRKLDLLVVCDIYMSDTAWYADVVLPESTYLERDEGFMDASGAAPAYVLRQQVVKPLYDTKPHWQIFKDLAAKLDLAAYFPWQDMDEFRAQQMAGHPDLLRMGEDKGFANLGLKPLFLRDPASVAAFVQAVPAAAKLVNGDGIITAPLNNLKTPSKKIELLSQEAEELFHKGLPSYERPAFAAGNNLLYIQGKVAVHTNGHTHNVPWLHDLMPENNVWINPATAARVGVKNGDMVEIASTTGKQRGRALVTPGVRPDTVFTYFGFGRLSPGLKRAYHKGVAANAVLPPDNAPVCGTAVHTTPVTVQKV